MKNEECSCDLVVIGAGPAGMLCAVTAAERGRKVTVLDGNRDPGRKLRITGKGRCNVTNNCEIREVLNNVPRNGKFLYSALNAFPPSAVMSYFENLGVPLKTERGNRVFPVSDNANDIANALAAACRRAGVRFHRVRAKEILTENGRVAGVQTEEGIFRCSAVALCTGGLSYPLTGSDGFGYREAARLGHTIVPPRASLVPLESDDPWCGELQGLSLRNVELRVYEDEKLLYSDFGEMLFTHFGVSGPIVLSASAHMRFLGEKAYRMEIDLKPALDEKTLDARILRDFGNYSNREIRNALGDLLPSSLIPVVLDLTQIPPETVIHSVTREQRERLRRLLKAFPVSVSGTRPIDEAIVTSGGIEVKEVDPRTMQSKLVPGLYFAGEILDTDAYTGGFNLQIAWSTGFTAGRAVCANDKEKDP